MAYPVTENSKPFQKRRGFTIRNKSYSTMRVPRLKKAGVGSPLSRSIRIWRSPKRKENTTPSKRKKRVIQKWALRLSGSVVIKETAITAERATAMTKRRMRLNLFLIFIKSSFHPYEAESSSIFCPQEGQKRASISTFFPHEGQILLISIPQNGQNFISESMVWPH